MYIYIFVTHTNVSVLSSCDFVTELNDPELFYAES